MCFSAEASFVAGATLVPAGAYCLQQTWKKQPRYLPLAAVPLIFGLQQISEGFVWLGLEHGHPTWIRPASLIYLFFALAFWPFWFPLLTAMMDTRPIGRRFFFVLSGLSTIWFWILYFPLLVGPESLLSVQIVHHSILYHYPDLQIYQHVPRTPLRLIYLMNIACPMALGSENWGRVPGLILGLSALIAFLVFEYAFVSVWCFFAAVLASYLCWFFYKLPSQEGPQLNSEEIIR